MSSIAPAVIGIAGTLGGGTLSAAVSLWSTKVAYTRQRRLDLEKAETDRVGRHRDHRRQLYAEWVVVTENVGNAATRGRPADMADSLGQLVRVSAAIALSGTHAVRFAVGKEQAAWLHVVAALHERLVAIEGARELHEATLEAMRADLAEI